MPKTLQFRRDTTAGLSSVTGAEGEIFIDTTKDTVVVMDGSTAGGFPLAKYTDVTTANTAMKGYVDSVAGGGSTGSFTFTANVISLPNFTDGELQVRGNVAEIAGSFNNGDWVSAKVNSSLSSGKTVIDLQTQTGQELNTLIAAGGLTGGNVEFRQVGNTSILRTGTIQSWTVSSTVDGIQTSALTFTSNVGAVLNEDVTEMDVYYTPTATTESFKFTKTGEFISHSALLGNVLVDDNIITPVPVTTSVYNYYGNTTVVTDQPLVINGDLEVLGTTKNAPGYVVFFGSLTNQQLDANRQYLINNGTTNSLVLPQNPKIGDVVVINRGLNNLTLTLAAGSGDSLQYWNGSGITGTGSITLGVTYKFRTFTCIAQSTSSWLVFDNTTDANPVA